MDGNPIYREWCGIIADKDEVMLVKSILIVAHPDDEALWFSSVIDKVDKVVICFLECRSRPDWSMGRKKSLGQHPVKSLTCFDLEESEVFNCCDWNNPVISKHGVDVYGRQDSERRYKSNYHKLKNLLERELVNYQNVIVHNPWGEYGNEEHIQIYRAVKELQDKINFDIWFPGYFSNKNIKLMSMYVHELGPEYVTFKTNIDLGEHIKDIYQKNQCWSWYDDWKWNHEESFIRDRIGKIEDRRHGYIVPMNMINVKAPPLSEKKGNLNTVHRLFKYFKGTKNNV